MPTSVKPENQGFVDRFDAGFRYFGYGRHGGGTEFARVYIGSKLKAPMVTDWRKGRYLPGDEAVLSISQDWGCSFEWLKFGRGAAEMRHFDAQQKKKKDDI